ncbi:dihydrolipoyl dehydrogenase, mitochondrial-like [Schistocerca gregaria]|uniref:dihydrolipoyl dehydrogenase, mitochondrial-like n=1 Tax=Schistocerca gregaria TaxID=7010 RepID=UPI00211F04CA|nr:dihydrolipoyl dehydrogenase, mitochondrial-like [Schistocerca gregaria]
MQLSLFRHASRCVRGARAYSSGGEGEVRDVVVIGGGPGGYVAAIKAAQLGMSVTCIEKRGTLGGTCLNVGCIPSKSLLQSSHMYEHMKHYAASRGVICDNPRFDLKAMMKTKEDGVRTLCGGVEQLFAKNKVRYVKGRGRFRSPTEVEVLGEGEVVKEVVRGRNVIIASGSEPTPLKGVEVNERNIVTSTGALSLEKVPRRMVVIGGGVIGLELGSVWSRLGAEVTVVEYAEVICANADLEMSKQFKTILEKQNLRFKMRMAVQRAVSQEDGTVRVELSEVKSERKETVEADVVLVAVGRRPYTTGLGTENIQLKMKDLMIETDEHFRTNVPNVYAIGDVIKGPMLAHKAEEEGIAVVEYLHSGVGHVNYDAIPSVVYTSPELAWVGQTEGQLSAKGIKYKVGKFQLKANSRARTNGLTDGFVKFLADAETDRLLGVHMLGECAGELIAGPVFAMEYGASSEDVARTCHAHPTISEAIKEAAMATCSKPIHQ